MEVLNFNDHCLNGKDTFATLVEQCGIPKVEWPEAYQTKFHKWWSERTHEVDASCISKICENESPDVAEGVQKCIKTMYDLNNLVFGEFLAHLPGHKPKVAQAEAGQASNTTELIDELINEMSVLSGCYTDSANNIRVALQMTRKLEQLKGHLYTEVKTLKTNVNDMDKKFDRKFELVKTDVTKVGIAASQKIDKVDLRFEAKCLDLETKYDSLETDLNDKFGEIKEKMGLIPNLVEQSINCLVPEMIDHKVIALERKLQHIKNELVPNLTPATPESKQAQRMEAIRIANNFHHPSGEHVRSSKIDHGVESREDELLFTDFKDSHRTNPFTAFNQNYMDDRARNDGGSAESRVFETRRPPFHAPSLSRKLPKFDGKSRWETFYCKFLNYKSIYKWSDGEAASRLAEAFEADAADLYSGLPQEVRSDFTKLSNNFKGYFGKIDNVDVLRVKLRTEQQSSGETLKEFARRVSQLAYRAYPEDSRKAEEEGATTLLKGCQTREGAMYVSLNTGVATKTMSEVLQNIEKYEDLQESLSMSKPVTGGSSAMTSVQPFRVCNMSGGQSPRSDQIKQNDVSHFDMSVRFNYDAPEQGRYQNSNYGAASPNWRKSETGGEATYKGQYSRSSQRSNQASSPDRPYSRSSQSYTSGTTSPNGRSRQSSPGRENSSYSRNSNSPNRYDRNTRRSDSPDRQRKYDDYNNSDRYRPRSPSQGDRSYSPRRSGDFRSPSPRRPDTPTRDMKDSNRNNCFECHLPGHFAADCPSKRGANGRVSFKDPPVSPRAHEK